MPDAAAMAEDRFSDAADRDWSREALARLTADAARTGETNLLKLNIFSSSGVDIYLKDESTHPTGSLKHRLAHSLFVYGICNGWIREGTTVVESSSGSTAVSEAYFARLLGLSYVAVVPKSTSLSKVRLIEQFGGVCHLVGDGRHPTAVAAEIAQRPNHHFIDQFTYAERATDWRNGLGAIILEQLGHERYPTPEWVVLGAGTGGTSASIGRYIRFRGVPTRLAVVDPEGSAYFDGWKHSGCAVGRGSRIEGIGRPTVEPSFIGSVVDRMMRVPDAASIATMRWLDEEAGITAGGSTGTNVWGCLRLAAEMVSAGRSGSIVSLICDSGRRYANTYYDDDWLAQEGIDISGVQDDLHALLAHDKHSV
ncbi:PLP-dependent cysteine synthase family protein [Acrocarpospora pleiomorpha]|nr:PLP-dependent cysteine synthase family protein [Acrocarpospora pleiomorpha]